MQFYFHILREIYLVNSYFSFCNRGYWGINPLRFQMRKWLYRAKKSVYVWINIVINLEYYKFPINATIVPAIVSIIPRSQSRITIVSSSHPIASRWWWKGAIRNTFFPFRNFLLNIWIITERVSPMNILLIITNAKSVSVIIAITASVAPSASEPVSPINIWAGWILNQRNHSKTPTIMRQNAERINIPCIYVIAPYAKNWNNNNPQARPSSPSVIFTLFAVAINISIKSGI